MPSCPTAYNTVHQQRDKKGRKIERFVLSAFVAAELDFAFAPDGLPPYACPLCGLQVRQEFRQITFILRSAHEASDRMGLACACTAAFCFLSAELAACHLYRRRPAVGALIIDLQRAGAGEPSQCADAVADPAEKNREF